jgi:hypothetical protein
MAVPPNLGPEGRNKVLGDSKVGMRHGKRIQHGAGAIEIAARQKRLDSLDKNLGLPLRRTPHPCREFLHDLIGLV